MDLTPLQHASRRDEVDADRWRLMRAPLERRIAEEASRPVPVPARHRPRPAMSTPLGLWAVIATAAVVVVLVVAPTAPQSAGAAELLTRAAAYASSASAEGRVVSLRQRTLVPVGGYSDAPQGFIWDQQRTALRVPVGEGRWVRKRWSTVREYAFGDRSSVQRQLRDGDAAEASSGWTVTRPMIDTSADGVFVNDPPAPSRAPFGTYPEAFRALPRDPSRLLQALEAGSRDTVLDGDSAGDGGADDVLRTAYEVLTSGVADAGLQQAVFEALQRMPGLEILDRHATDLDGRVGVALGVAPDRSGSSGGRRELLVIDPVTGRLLGARSLLRSDWGVAPAGTPVVTSAVDSGLADDCCGIWSPAPDRQAYDYR